jgi:hypothetical protein
MGVVRRMNVHLPDSIVVQDLKGLHVTSVHIKGIGFVWHRNSPVNFCCEHDKEKSILMKYI